MASASQMVEFWVKKGKDTVHELLSAVAAAVVEPVAWELLAQWLKNLYTAMAEEGAHSATGSMFAGCVAPVLSIPESVKVSSNSQVCLQSSSSFAIA